MRPPKTLDSLVKERLRQWPQRPPGVSALRSAVIPGCVVARQTITDTTRS